ncbi:MAG: hypothetical protein MZV63_25875 [Marinilabiliales bacterium]|nr:hypothetical protein [Marinilabiliales bacterium]
MRTSSGRKQPSCRRFPHTVALEDRPLRRPAGGRDSFFSRRNIPPAGPRRPRGPGTLTF